MFFGIGTQTFYFIGNISIIKSVLERKKCLTQKNSTSFDIILSEYINAAFPPMHDKILQNSDEVVTLHVWPLLLVFLFLFFNVSKIKIIHYVNKKNYFLPIRIALESLLGLFYGIIFAIFFTLDSIDLYLNHNDRKHV
jgi:hypothetical protein